MASLPKARMPKNSVRTHRIRAEEQNAPTVVLPTGGLCPTGFALNVGPNRGDEPCP